MTPRGTMVFLMDNYPETVPIYWPDSCMFIKTDEQCAVGVMMKMTAESWVRHDKDKTTEQSEREIGPRQVSQHPLNPILNLKVVLNGEELQQLV